jgi:type II secretory pathway pseudopilin PulG
MAKRRRYGGFSLVEVLLAIATLAIGMMFIGGTFLAGVYFSTVSTERTIATVVANEAFAKLRVFLYDDPTRPGRLDRYDPNLATNRQTPTPLDVVGPAHCSLMGIVFDANEYAYPSTRTLADKQYFWSGLCRRDPDDPNHALVVTVFVSRKVGTATRYIGPAGPMSWPVPMRIRVAGTVGSNVLTILDDPKWIGEGYTIVEDSSGKIYRVVERGVDPAQIILDPDNPWLGGNFVWAVPPPLVRLAPPAVGGGGPCIVVYQTEIRF